MEKEGTIYEDQTMSGLFKLYVESLHAGSQVLTDLVWRQMCDLDLKDRDKNLQLMRDELDNILNNARTKPDNK